MQNPYDLENSLGYQLTLAARISERRFEQALAPIGLSRVKWCVLLAVAGHGHTSPSDIAAFIGIDRTAVSRALRQMEGDGHITRHDAKGDKRMIEVAATDQGRIALSQANGQAEKNAAHFSEKLSWYEKDALSDILAKLTEGEARDIKGL